MSSVTKKSNFGVAQIILFFSIAILVIVVAVPVLLILFNAFWVNGEFNLRDVANIIMEPETYKALTNSLIIASGTTSAAPSSAHFSPGWSPAPTCPTRPS